jgi:hypothetical protein
MALSRKCGTDVYIEFISLEEIEFKILKMKMKMKKRSTQRKRNSGLPIPHLKGPQNSESDAEGHRYSSLRGNKRREVRTDIRNH